MNISSIGNTSVYTLYNAMFRSSVSLSSIKLNRNFFPANRAKGKEDFARSAFSYVNNIKSASKELSDSLKDLSGTALKLSAENGAAEAKNSLKALVKNYNDLYVEAVKRGNDKKAQNLASKMSSIAKTYSRPLAGIGITFGSDSKMQLDETVLDAAAENGSLEKFFNENGRTYGFTSQLSRLSGSVANNTSYYVSGKPDSRLYTENFAYTRYGGSLQYNYLTAGLLFDLSF